MTLKISDLIERTNARLVKSKKGTHIALSNATRADVILVKRYKSDVIRYLQADTVSQPQPPPYTPPPLQGEVTHETPLVADFRQALGNWLLTFHWRSDADEPLLALPEHLAVSFAPFIGVIPQRLKVEYERKEKLWWNEWLIVLDAIYEQLSN